MMRNGFMLSFQCPIYNDNYENEASAFQLFSLSPRLILIQEAA